MTTLIDLTVRLTVIVVAGLVAVSAMRGRSAAVRHATLAGALLSAVLLVPIGWAVPAWDIRFPVWKSAHEARAPQVSVVAVSSEATPQGAVREMSLSVVATGLWVAGVVAACASMAAGLVRLRGIRRRAVPLTNQAWTSALEQLCRDFGIRRPVALLQSQAPDIVATWGVARPCITVPASATTWPEARVYAVLCHEVAHIARADWPVQLVAQAVSAVQWFNPLCWIAYRRLRQLSELACDDRALARGLTPTEYAMHLLDVTRICRPSAMSLSAVPMARPSTLERRVAAMLNQRIDRSLPSRRTLVAIAVGILALVTPVALIHAAVADPRPMTGDVYDSSGALLPDVLVALDDATGHHRETKTDAAGHFALESVAAGKYTLRVTMMGFAPLAEDVELRTTTDWVRSVTLQVGVVQETQTVEAERGASSAPPDKPVRLRVGGNIRAPRKLSSVNAVYPESMKAAGIEGKVPLEAVIGKDGTVRSVRVLTSQIHPDLAVAAADAVRQWKFEPTLLNGAPVEVIMKVTIDFRLKG